MRRSGLGKSKIQWMKVRDAIFGRSGVGRFVDRSRTLWRCSKLRGSDDQAPYEKVERESCLPFKNYERVSVYQFKLVTTHIHTTDRHSKKL